MQPAVCYCKFRMVILSMSERSDHEIYYVYIMECSDGSLYTGITNDTEKRLKIHNQGKGAKYTRGRLPVKIVYREEVGSKGDALRREAEIKKLERIDKLKLLKS